MIKRPRIGLTAALPMLLLSPLSLAIQMEVGETGSLKIDNVINYGALWRVQGQNPDNDGINNNDGNRNYDTGLVSQVLSLTTEMDLNYGDYGLFMRGSAYKDFEMSGDTNYGEEDFHTSQPSQASMRGTKPNNRFTDEAIDASKGAEILDAYLYGYKDVGDMTVSGKLGRHVIWWGESLFSRNGVGDINAVDAAKLRLPGVGIKDAILPAGAASLNVGINENLDFETFYMFEYRETKQSAVGSYYSTGDMFAPGGNTAYNRTPNALTNPALMGAHQNLVNAGVLTPTYYTEDAIMVASIEDEELASDDGQFGVAFRYRAEELNFTEFGFYYINYHSKTPIVNANINENYDEDTFNAIQSLTLNANPQLDAQAKAGLTALEVGANTEARRKYLEDLSVMGVSFNTLIGETVIAGEIAYRPDMPITVSSSDDLIKDLLDQVQTQAATGNYSDTYILGGQSYNTSTQGSIDNYVERDVYNASLSATHSFGSSRFYDQLIGVGEVAYEYIDGDLTYQAYDGSTRDFVSKAACSSSSTCADDGKITNGAWGYALALSSRWNSVLPGVQLAGSLRYKEDVNGNSHRTGNFVEGTKAITVGMKATFYNNFTTGLSYTNFHGGTNNRLRDRDNVAATMSYSF